MHEYSSKNGNKNNSKKEIIDRYERVKKKKRYRQRNNQERIINIKKLHSYLMNLDSKELKIRLHYQLMGNSEHDDLPNITLDKFVNLEKADFLFSIEKIYQETRKAENIYQISAKNENTKKLAQYFPLLEL